MAQLQQQTSLNLFNCRDITDTSLVHVSNLQQLTSLNLHLCANVTDAGLELVAKLQQLTTLNVHACAKITDKGTRPPEHWRFPPFQFNSNPHFLIPAAAVLTLCCFSAFLVHILFMVVPVPRCVLVCIHISYTVANAVETDEVVRHHVD